MLKKVEKQTMYLARLFVSGMGMTLKLVTTYFTRSIRRSKSTYPVIPSLIDKSVQDFMVKTPLIAFGNILTQFVG